MSNAKVTLETYPYNLLEEVFGDQVEWIDDEDHRAGLDKALSTLTEREQQIIQFRYFEQKTLDETCKQFGVTRERVRQCEAKAIRKLRHPARQNMIIFGYEGASEYSGLKNKERELHERESILKEREERLVNILARLKPILEEMDMWGENASETKETSIEYSTMKLPIENLDLSVRSFGCLRRAGAFNVEDVVKIVESGKLLHVRNLGRKSAEEIITKLAEYGIDYRDKEEYKCLALVGESV